MTGFYKRHNRPVDHHCHRRRRRLRSRVRDNGAIPDAERAQMTSVCHTHGENYHFKFVNVHAAAIRRRRGLLSGSNGKTLERRDASGRGKDDGSGHYYDNTDAPRSLSASFAFCVSVPFRSALFLCIYICVCYPPPLSPLLATRVFFFLQHSRAFTERSRRSFPPTLKFSPVACRCNGYACYR